ncbi:hypothetical protein [uncultured Prevotella sp.]|uniref:hypothetical protein n=1 Tax=uncultured Prevotella sp. TaxID=159272 RepID=UPI0025D10991|nr:hypothetical protein [uncultured Prevotella sp.]
MKDNKVDTSLWDIEAKFIDYNKLNDETLPANGGIRSYFGHHSFNHSMLPQEQKYGETAGVRR